MTYFHNLFETYQEKLLTIRFTEFMMDFGLVKSAFLFFALPFFIIMMLIPGKVVSNHEVLLVSALMAFPGLFLEFVLLYFISVFECMAHIVIDLCFGAARPDEHEVI